MSFTDRVKAIRADVGLTQNDFAKSLGMTRDSYVNFEYDRIKNQNAINPTIKAVCQKYKINENWLRTGEGEMYIAETREDEIQDIVAKILVSEDSDFRLNLTRILYQTSNEDMETLYKMAKRWIDEVNRTRDY